MHIMVHEITQLAYDGKGSSKAFSKKKYLYIFDNLLPLQILYVCITTIGHELLATKIMTFKLCKPEKK